MEELLAPVLRAAAMTKNISFFICFIPLFDYLRTVSLAAFSPAAYRLRNHLALPIQALSLGIGVEAAHRVVHGHAGVASPEWTDFDALGEVDRLLVEVRILADHDNLMQQQQALVKASRAMNGAEATKSEVRYVSKNVDVGALDRKVMHLQ